MTERRGKRVKKYHEEDLLDEAFGYEERLPRGPIETLEDKDKVERKYQEEAKNDDACNRPSTISV